VFSTVTPYKGLHENFKTSHQIKTYSFLINQLAMKTYRGGVEVQIDVFLTSALDGGEWSALSPGKEPPVPTG
jgi:hypothetical protein